MTKIKPLLIVMLLLLIAALAGISLLGSYTRLHADDFCIAADAPQMDIFSFFTKWYLGWTGRFAYIPAAGLLAFGGPVTTSLLPPLAITVWFLCTAWAALPGFRSLSWPNPRLTASVFSGFFLLVLFSATPNLFQSVFWKDGLINYTFPLIGITANIGWLLRFWLDGGQKTPSGLNMVIIFLCAFISGGFSEIFSTTQVAFYAFMTLTLISLPPQAGRRHLLPVLLIGLLGSLGAYAIVLSAPGNTVRQGLIADHPGLIRLVTFSLRNGLVIIVKYFVFTPLWSALSIMIPFLAGFSFHPRPPSTDQSSQPVKASMRKRTWFKAVLALPLMAFVLCVAACAPVVYMLNAYPDDRSIIIPLYFLTAAVMASSGFWGYGARELCGRMTKKWMPQFQRISLALILAGILAASGASLYGSYMQLGGYRDYAQRWDERHQLLNDLAAQGARNTIAFGLENRFGISDLRVEPDYWVNRCMADFYGFSSLTGK